MSAATRRIRVCHIVTRLAVRGVPRHVIDMAAGLDPERFAVEILTGHSEPNEGDLWQEAQDKGLSLVRIQSMRRRVDPRADISALWQIYSHLRAHPCDIVHTHISKAGILGRLAAHWAGVPISLHTYHGVPSEWEGVGRGARIFRYCEMRAARSTNRLVAVSNAVKEGLEGMSIGRDCPWQVIYNGIPTLFFQPREWPIPPTNLPYLLAIGSLTREKGIEILIEALAKLRRDYPNLSLCLLGDGPLRDALKRRVAEMELNNWVHFVGIVEDVRPWLKHCALLAVPSLSEGMGLAAVEAMAMGRPVVASAVGGLLEVVVDGETGRFARPGDADHLAEQVDALLRAPGECTRLGDNGCERAKQYFSIDRSIAELQNLYEHLAIERGQR
jgi:glycosyltransferase involved in cell wall biosynthesis